MSLADGNPEGRGVFVRKQRANVYTVMLVIALVEILVGCLFLYLQMNAYHFQVKVPPNALFSYNAPAAVSSPARQV